MEVILIGGKARSGKDTMAEIIMNELESTGKKVCRIQVGQYIKYYAMKYFGWDGSEETKPRDLLNKLGTEIIREKIDPDFHVDRLIQDIKILSYFYDTFIVSDIRFPVEIEKTRGAFSNVASIKINRESDELNAAQKHHISETILDDYKGFDYYVDNNGSLEELSVCAKNILREMGDLDERV